MARRIAVVLFNLGGPDNLAAVRPFLFNLFHDPAIIAVPQPLRWLLAKFIAARRAPVARQIYRQMGGRSPLRAETDRQAAALAASLTDDNDDANQFLVTIAMRYWHPLSDEAARAVKAFAPDEIVLLPLYPQFSATTTGSSLRAWLGAAAAAGVTAPTHAVGCYPDHPALARAQAALIATAVAQLDAPVRLLFSAHGLPKRRVERGDPYQWQVERTAAAVVAALGRADLEWVVCYQSRVGPLEWIGPATDDEIRRAGADGMAVVVVPIAFVSEHSETLVELDIEYRELAEQSGVPNYVRVPALGDDATFIQGLASLVRQAMSGPAMAAYGAARCPDSFAKCACRVGGACV